MLCCVKWHSKLEYGPVSMRASISALQRASIVPIMFLTGCVEETTDHATPCPKKSPMPQEMNNLGDTSSKNLGFQAIGGRGGLAHHPTNIYRAFPWPMPDEPNTSDLVRTCETTSRKKQREEERMLELCFLLQLCVVYALPSFIAQATSSSPVAVSPPSPTPPPSFHHDLLRRAEASRLCGWVDGKSESAYYCNQTDATCLWNNEKKTVGCGDSASMSSVTSCYDFGSSRNCDEKCRANPENLFCPSSAPYCNVVAFPNSFSRILDCSNNITQQLTVALTYENFRTQIHLPRSIVSGIVAAATQTPTVPKSTETGVNKGSIIAASVGGAVLLLGLPFGIKMFWRRRQWSKAQRPRRLQEREMRRQWAEPSNPYSRSAIPDPPPPAAGQNFLFSQDWHGQSKTARTGATNYEMQGNG